MDEYNDIGYLIKKLVDLDDEAWEYFYNKKYGRLIHKCISKYANSSKCDKIREEIFHEVMALLLEDNCRRLRGLRFLEENVLKAYLWKLTLRCTLKFLDEEIIVLPTVSYFQLTDQSLEKLKNKNIPQDIINCLKSLKNRIYIDKKQFVEILKNIIGIENTKTYKSLILKHTIHKRGDWVPIDDIIEIRDISPPLDEKVFIRQLYDIIIKYLDPEEQLVLDFLLEGLTLEEIAGLMGISLTAVFDIKERAIKKIKKYLK